MTLTFTSTGQLLYRRQPGGGAGDLDHHVRLIEPLPETGRLRDRGVGVIGKVRGALERDEPVAVVALVEGGRTSRAGPTHLVERKREEQLL